MSEFLELIDDTNCGFNPIPKIYHDYAPTLRAGRFGLKKKEVDDLGDIRIRKLTPTECYKLMGFSAEDCKKRPMEELVTLSFTNKPVTLS